MTGPWAKSLRNVDNTSSSNSLSAQGFHGFRKRNQEHYNRPSYLRLNSGGNEISSEEDLSPVINTESMSTMHVTPPQSLPGQASQFAGGYSKRFTTSDGVMRYFCQGGHSQRRDMLYTHQTFGRVPCGAVGYAPQGTWGPIFTKPSFLNPVYSPCMSSMPAYCARPPVMQNLSAFTTGQPVWMTNCTMPNMHVKRTFSKSVPRQCRQSSWKKSPPTQTTEPNIAQLNSHQGPDELCQDLSKMAISSDSYLSQTATANDVTEIQPVTLQLQQDIPKTVAISDKSPCSNINISDVMGESGKSGEAAMPGSCEIKKIELPCEIQIELPCSDFPGVTRSCDTESSHLNLDHKEEKVDIEHSSSDLDSPTEKDSLRGSPVDQFSKMSLPSTDSFSVKSSTNGKKKRRPSKKKRCRQKNQRAQHSTPINVYSTPKRIKMEYCDVHDSPEKSNLGSVSTTPCGTVSAFAMSFLVDPAASDDEDFTDSDNDDWDMMIQNESMESLFMEFAPLSPLTCHLSMPSALTNIFKDYEAASVSQDSSRLEAINASWQQHYNNRDTCNSPGVSCSSSGAKKRKVRFASGDLLSTQHSVEDCERKGPWEQYARDHCRFQDRIHHLEPTLSPVLTPSHRQKVYKKYHTPPVGQCS